MTSTTLVRRLLAVATLVTAGTLLSGTAHSAGAIPGAPGPVASSVVDDPRGARVIVRFKTQAGVMRSAARAATPAWGPQHAATLRGRTGLALRDGRIVDRRSQVVHGGQGLTSAALAQRLAADPDVEYAVPDRRRRAMAVPNDPLFAASAAISPAAGQWYLRAPDATFVSAINAAGAWDINTGSASITVADIDTGVRFEHPDLAGKLHPGHDFIADLADAADGDGVDPDASDPGDWTTANQCLDGAGATISSWHGTQTAGLIAARTGNGLGMASVGRNVMVLPVRVLGKCGGFDSDIIAAMLWAGGVSANPVVNLHPARVLNLSLGGGGGCSAAYQDAVTQLTAAGVVIVVSAGNDEGLGVSTPANCPGVIAVAGVRNVGTKVGFSNIGPEVAIAAPGGNCINVGVNDACLYPILTTTNAGTQGPAGSAYSDSFDISVGTSFSAPLVSGTAALMLSANPALTAAQVRNLLQGTARAFPVTSSDPTVPQCRAPDAVPQDECLCTTSTCGAGLLDASAAVAAAAANLRPTASVSASRNTVQAGGTVDVDAGASTAVAGRTITGYQWTITSGAAIATFSGSLIDRTATVVTSGAGSVTVQVTVTDSAGSHAASSTSLTVTAAPGTGGGTSGGGGGAMQPGWLAGLALAVAALAWRRRRAKGSRGL
jgi:serine protease